MKPISILYLLDYASLVNLGGDAQVAFETSAALARRGHKVIIFAGNEHLEHEITSRGIRLVSFYYNPLEAKTSKKFHAVTAASIKRFKKILGGERFDIAVFHQPLISWGFRNRKFLKNARKVYFFHSPWHVEYAASSRKRWGVAYSMATRIRRNVERLAVKDAECAVTLSRHMKNRLARLHRYSKDKIHVIPGGVDTENFKPPEDMRETREALDLPQDSPVLFCLRRLVPRMGIDNLIKSMPAVLEKYPETILVIGGTGPMENELVTLAQSQGVLNSVRFPGYVDDGDVRKYYGVADASVVPTRELEGFGLVLLESLASGTPVLATPVGGMPEILGPFRPEWISSTNTSEAIGEKIIAFLDSGGASAALRSECREHAKENFTWDLAAGRLEKLFIGLM